MPWCFITVVSQSTDVNRLFEKERPRGHLQGDASWKPIMFYDVVEPWVDAQGVYSIFWWNMAVKVPVMFRFTVACSKFVLETNYAKQQKEINEIGTMLKQPKENWEVREEPRNEDPDNEAGIQEEENWRDYSMFGKLKFYYKHNGLKKTASYCFDKYVRRVK